MMGKIRSFWNRLNEFKNYDPDSARRGRLVNILLVGMLLLGALAFAIIVTILSVNGTWGKPGNLLLVVTLVVVILGSLGLLIVNQYSVRYASFLFLALLTVTFAFSDEPAQLANGRSSFVFFIPVLISSLLLSPISSFFFAIVNTVTMIWLSNTGNVVPNVSTMVSLFMVAFISWLSSRSLEQALAELRTINTNLDRLVEQKTQELAATLSRELILAGRNEAILNSIADGVVVFDEHNRSILANPALSQLTETPLYKLVDKDITEFAQNESLSSSARNTLLDLMGKPKMGTAGIRIPWGGKILSTSIARVRDTGGNSIGTVAVFRDITREAELERMKTTFMAIVSHELRTPLNAILGFAEMLKEGVYGTVSEKQQNISARIMNNTQRLLSIVSDLLDQAQIESGKLKVQMVSCKPAEMLEALHSVMDKIASDKGIEFTTSLDPAMPPVILGDPQRLQQVMINLANNAVKFTNEGSVQVNISRAGEKHWQIQTIDTGGGIPKEAQEYIFETFRQVEGASTRQHGGVGLGLSIVKQLVEIMKGNIVVESEMGKGSTFTAKLPLFE
jgi:PAS domain S-box-containing protein